jgi:hypothetical protein
VQKEMPVALLVQRHRLSALQESLKV